MGVSFYSKYARAEASWGSCGQEPIQDFKMLRNRFKNFLDPQ